MQYVKPTIPEYCGLLRTINDRHQASDNVMPDEIEAFMELAMNLVEELRTLSYDVPTVSLPME